MKSLTANYIDPMMLCPLLKTLDDQNAYCQSQHCDCDNCKLGQQLVKLAELEDLEEQGLLLRLPCVAGQKVYIIATCKDFANFEDYNIYGEEDYFYCPYEIGEKCPFEECFDECIGGCENFKDTSTIFEDFVESIMCYANENVVFLSNYGGAGFHYFGKTIFLTKAEAEAALAEMGCE